VKTPPKRHIFVGVLFAVAVLLFVRMLTGWGSVTAVPLPKAPQLSDFEKATAPATAVPAAPAAGRRKAAREPSLDPRLRLKLLAQSEQVEYKGTGRNIFDRASAPEIERPKSNGQKLAAQQPPPPPVPQGPPPPPPINLKFFGFASSIGGPRQVFLAQGEDVFVAKEGDIVNRRYKVVRIAPSSVEIEDVLNNSRQTIPLTQG
jgi:hypothetical protein